MGKTLKEYVKDNSKFLKLKSGESFEGVYLGYKVVPDTFNPDQEKVVYKLAYPDGKEIFFNTASVKVAHTFQDFSPKDGVKITRDGEGPKTTYDVEKIVDMGAPEMSGDPEVNPDIEEF